MQAPNYSLQCLTPLLPQRRLKPLPRERYSSAALPPPMTDDVIVAHARRKFPKVG